MRKVLHISKYYYPFRGGTEQIAQNCVTALKDEYEQMVFCFNHESSDSIDEIDGIKVVRANCFAKIASQSLSFSYGKLLKKSIYSFKPDIIIFHYPNPFGAHYFLKYIPKDTKLVIYWHLDIVKQKFLKKFFKRQNNHIIKRADKIIATSPNYIEGSPWMQQVRNKCVVIPNCINTSRFKKNDQVEKLATKIKLDHKDKIVCLAIGRHTEYKGFKYLIEASKYLDSRFKIYITGKGELTEKLKKQAEGNNKIIFLGLVSDIELKAYMTAMDIFCFSSITKNEAFGLALVEAMYYEKPSVTFTIEGSGVNYVSPNGVTGIEVPNRDVKAYAKAIMQLADYPKLREKYGKAAKQRVVENFLDSSFGESIRKEINKLQ